MAPQYRVSEHKYSPARIQEMKQQMKAKISRDIAHYVQLGTSEEMSN